MTLLVGGLASAPSMGERRIARLATIAAAAPVVASRLGRLFTLLDCLLPNFGGAGENNISHLSCSIITGFALATTAGARASMETQYFRAMSRNPQNGFSCFGD